MTEQTLPYTPENLAEIIVHFNCSIPTENRIQIRSSRNVNAILRAILNPNEVEYKEQFYVLCLSRSNHVLGYFLHSSGGLSGTIVDVKQLLAVAIKSNSASIILSHTHPSGNLKPSNADIKLTKKIVNASALLDITVLDHIIVTKDGFYSFADEGALPYATVDAVQKVEEYACRLRKAQE